jgi:hypothetical protein
MFASQHSERLSGLVYLDGAGDATTPAYDPPMPDPTTLPRPSGRHRRPTAARSQRSHDDAIWGVIFPEAEWHPEFAANPDGSVGRR